MGKRSPARESRPSAPKWRTRPLTALVGMIMKDFRPDLVPKSFVIMDSWLVLTVGRWPFVGCVTFMSFCGA